MSAIDELAYHCRRRGWRLGVDGSYPDGRHNEGFVANRLEVRSHTDRDLLASVSFDPANMDDAAVDAARSLERQGLIT